jgi:hypothetical protein
MILAASLISGYSQRADPQSAGSVSRDYALCLSVAPCPPSVLALAC